MYISYSAEHRRSCVVIQGTDTAESVVAVARDCGAFRDGLHFVVQFPGRSPELYDEKTMSTSSGSARPKLTGVGDVSGAFVVLSDTILTGAPPSDAPIYTKVSIGKKALEGKRTLLYPVFFKFNSLVPYYFRDLALARRSFRTISFKFNKDDLIFGKLDSVNR